MMTFEEALWAHGLRPTRRIVPDDRWHRCPTVDKPKSTNGAYRLTHGGRIGWYMDWAKDSRPILWRADGSASPLPPVLDPEEERRKREKEKRALQLATANAREFYARCKPLRGGHPYLDRHGLDMTGCEGLRVDAEGWLVVPAYRNGALISLQRIAPDGEKRFWPGASMRGVSYVVDRPKASYTVLCEGLATGLAIYACSDLVRVVIAFMASNLIRVAETWPYRGFVAVAADNDWQTAERIGKNPGVIAAEDAARVLGCGVMAPENIRGSDWCDYVQERIAERLARKRKFESENRIRQSVHAEVFSRVQQAARFLSKPLAETFSLS